MQQRYYDPGIGRFLSVDPVTANSGTGANFNRYWYANNNPYKFTDPDGRQSQDFNWISKEAGVTPPPRSPNDKLGPAIGVALTIVMAPAVGLIATEVGVAALANPATANAIVGGAIEAGAGEALGGASLAAGVALTGKQAANLARFEKSMPAGNTGVAVDNLGDGVVFTSSVPGNVPGSQAVYQKTVDAAGDTSSLLKTTTNPKAMWYT